MLDIGQDQFLVLLLVVQSQLDQESQLTVAALLIEQHQQMRIHMVTVSEYFSQRRSRQQATLGPWVHVASRVVIGVEQVMKPRMEFFVIGQVRAQDKLLEKPARMGQMPFRRADIGHALDDRVLGRQWFDQFLGLAADLPISAHQGARFSGRLLLRLRGIHDPIRNTGYTGYRLPQRAVKAKG